MISMQSNRKGDIMAIMTVRSIPDEIHRALRIQAAKHGRSTEAEVRGILINAVTSRKRVKLGSLLKKIGAENPLEKEEVCLFERSQDTTPPVNFE